MGESTGITNVCMLNSTWSCDAHLDVAKSLLSLPSAIQPNPYVAQVKPQVTHPDSLKPMCPILPMPKSCISMPPAACMAASYSAQNLHDSAACSIML